MSAKPKTQWQRTYGHKRPSSRWARQRDKRERQRERHPIALECAFCGRRRGCFTSEAARTAHEYQDHRGAYLRRELLEIERDAKPRYGGEGFAVDDCRSWAFHPLARRYRRLMRLWWQLDKAEYSAAMDWWPGEGLPKSYPLTRLGWPSTEASGVSWTWYTQPWLKAVQKHWPEKWSLVQAATAKRGGVKGGRYCNS